MGNFVEGVIGVVIFIAGITVIGIIWHVFFEYMDIFALGVIIAVIVGAYKFGCFITEDGQAKNIYDRLIQESGDFFRIYGIDGVHGSKINPKLDDSVVIIPRTDLLKLLAYRTLAKSRYSLAEEQVKETAVALGNKWLMEVDGWTAEKIELMSKEYGEHFKQEGFYSLSLGEYEHRTRTQRFIF